MKFWKNNDFKNEHNWSYCFVKNGMIQDLMKAKNVLKSDTGIKLVINKSIIKEVENNTTHIWSSSPGLYRTVTHS